MSQADLNSTLETDYHLRQKKKSLNKTKIKDEKTHINYVLISPSILLEDRHTCKVLYMLTLKAVTSFLSLSLS